MVPTHRHCGRLDPCLWTPAANCPGASIQHLVRRLPAALKALARRSPIPVEVEVDLPERLPESIEVGAYYVVSEALANAAKHAQASVVQVEVRISAGTLSLSVVDDGVGGADTSRGSGLPGLADRVQALGGAISITSPAGRGTTLTLSLPISGR